MILLIAIAAAAQGEAASTVFPENVVIGQRYDCEIRSASREKRGPVPYPAGDYVFLFPADTGLISGKSIPYIHSRADGQTSLENAVIEPAAPDLGGSFGFALRTRSGAMLAFTKRGVEADGRARVRGSYQNVYGDVVELEGACRVRYGPVIVNMPSP